MAGVRRPGWAADDAIAPKGTAEGWLRRVAGRALTRNPSKEGSGSGNSLLWWYAAQVMRVVDGDTAYFRVDLGFEIAFTIDVRFLGIDTPEVYGTNASPEGRAAWEYLQEMLPVGRLVILRTERDSTGKYGRYLAEIYLPGDEVSVNQKLIDAGHAVPYEE